MTTLPPPSDEPAHLRFDQEQRGLIRAAICVALRRIADILGGNLTIDIRTPALRNGPPTFAAMVMAGIGAQFSEDTRAFALKRAQISTLREILEIATFYFPDLVRVLADDEDVPRSPWEQIMLAEDLAQLQAKLKAALSPSPDPEGASPRSTRS